MTQVQALNVLTGPTKTVYLNEPRNKALEEEDQNEPLTPSENGTPTSSSSESKDVDWKKRHDDLKAHYDRGIQNAKEASESQINELRTQVQELTDKVLEKNSVSEMPKTIEEWGEFQKKYPELAANMLTAATIVNKGSSDIVQQKLKQIEQKTDAINAREGIIELKKYHPDFEQIKDDPRFLEWFNSQPTEIKALIKSPNPKVIAAGLDKFKEFAGIKTQVQKVEAKKDATRDVKVPTGRVQIVECAKRTYSNAEIWKMSPNEFEKNKDDIVAAQYDGRIVG